MEAASGAAGLAKLLLMLRHRTIPRQILFKNLNPKIAPLELDHIIISTHQIPWLPSEDGCTRVALLNNFGAAGSNAALILEEYSNARPPTPTPTEVAYVFGISAKTERSLGILRSRFLTCFKALKAKALISAISRIHQLLGGRYGRTELLALRKTEGSSSRDSTRPYLCMSLVSRARSFSCFPVRGASILGWEHLSTEDVQYSGGISMNATHFLFHLASLAFCRSSPLTLRSLGANQPQLDTVEAFQAAVFALEYALAKLWMSWGIKPAGVVGYRFVQNGHCLSYT